MWTTKETTYWTSNLVSRIKKYNLSVIQISVCTVWCRYVYLYFFPLHCRKENKSISVSVYAISKTHWQQDSRDNMQQNNILNISTIYFDVLPWNPAQAFMFPRGWCSNFSSRATVRLTFLVSAQKSPPPLFAMILLHLFSVSLEQIVKVCLPDNKVNEQIFDLTEHLLPPCDLRLTDAI